MGGYFLLPVEVVFYLRLGLCCLRLVFVAYGNLVGSFLLTVEIRFGLFPDLPSLAFFGKSKENHAKKQGFFSMPNS